MKTQSLETMVKPMQVENSLDTNIEKEGLIRRTIRKIRGGVKGLAYATVFGLALAGGIKTAKAQPVFEIIPVITDPNGQYSPDIWGKYIVWSGRGNKVYDIPQRKLVEMPGLPSRIDPYIYKTAISNNKIVCKGWTGYYDIDLQQMIPLNGGSIGKRPAIHNNKIVWEGSTGYYDIDLQKMVYPEGLSIGNSPAIHNNKIVWDGSTGYYDIDKEQMVYPEGLSIGWYPAMYDNKIVWRKATGYYDIDLQQMVHPEGLSGIDFDPDIFKDNIVWWYGLIPGPPSNIFIWNPIYGTRQITESGRSYRPKIYNNIVVWDCTRNEGGIYMAIILDPDLNKDGFVDFRDYAILVDNWMKTGLDLNGDINRDNKVGYKDLEILTENWLDGI